MSVSFSNNIYANFLKKSGTSSVPASIPVQNKEIASVKVGDVNTETSNIGKKKLFGIIGISVGSAALLSLVALFTLSKGFSSGFSKKFSLISEQFKKIIEELSDQSKQLTQAQKLKLKITKKLQPLAEYMEASSNITAIKDSAMNKLLKKLKMESVVNKINKFFKDKIVLKTKNNAYQSAELSVVELSNYLEKLAKQENKPELLEKSKEIAKIYFKHFSLKSHVSRSERNWEEMKNLSESVYKNLFNKDGRLLKNFKQLKTYVTTDLTTNERIQLQKELSNGKNALKTKIDETFELISPQQKEILQKYVSKTGKRLNHAIESEIKAFNKLAEIRVGSVSTDILGIIAPSALATAMIVESDNKKERIGTALTKGIPIFGAIGASYYGATRGFTGAKNLALGLATGYVLNVLGRIANDGYKKYAERQTVLQKAFDAWNKHLEG